MFNSFYTGQFSQIDRYKKSRQVSLAEIYRQKVASLQTALNDPALRDQAFELIRSLIDQILLTPENGTLRVDIKGDLAGILELCATGQKRKPGTVSGAGLLTEQFKMVAGLGFEPRTFRL